VVQIRADVRYDALPVIALTGESVSDVVLDALSCGMDDVMQKPVDLKTLSKTIATALKAKRRESIPRLPLYQPK
jgi:CheY-like chemotaxis protein